MQFSGQELKDRLLRALDGDNNVVDMPALLEVFSALEKLPVTRDLLEETRLGKYVNDMRKKTTNKDLAKRAKNLVRRWQATVMPSTPAAPSPFNGDNLGRHCVAGSHLLKTGSKPCSPLSRPDTPSSVASSNSPCLQQAHGNVSNNRLSPKAGGYRPATPILTPGSPALYNKIVNTNNSANTTVSGGFQDTPKIHNGHNSNTRKIRPSTPTGNQETFSKTSVANKRKRKNGGTEHEIPEKKHSSGNACDSASFHCKQNTVINGMLTSTPKHRTDPKDTSHKYDGKVINDSTLSNSFPNKGSLSATYSRTYSTNSLHSETSDRNGSSTPTTSTVRTPRVKTTAELVAEMARGGSLNVRDSEAIKRIALNQIEKEKDEDTPIVPVGAKPRARRKPKGLSPPPTSDTALTATKHEMVHKFLETAIPPSTNTLTTSDSVDLNSSCNSHLVRNLDMSRVHAESSSIELPSDRPPETLSLSHGEPSGHSSSTLSSSTKDDATSQLLSLINQQSLDHSGGGETSRIVEAMAKAGDTSSAISDLCSLLPPFDEESIDWNSLHYSIEEPAEVNKEAIERLHDQHWPGVNGVFNAQNDWRNWTATYSMPSYDGDSLHILPYVVIDQNEDLLPDIS